MRTKLKILLAVLVLCLGALGYVLYDAFVLYPRLGVYAVSTAPKDATVFVDGEKVGKTPYEITKKAGKYLLRVELDGYEVVEQDIEIKKGEFEIQGLVLEKVE